MHEDKLFSSKVVTHSPILKQITDDYLEQVDSRHEENKQKKIQEKV